jgi:lipid-binding SYLF domain-containing protein
MATQSKNRKQQKPSHKQSSSSKDPTAQRLEKRVEATLKRLEAKDPGLRKLLEKAYGYAVFPSVGKAALVVGGSYGRGAAFEKEKMIGYATISQMTIGVQIGGDTFTEILIFNDKDSLKRFKQGRMAFAANASAVLVKAAAAGTNNFKGVTALAYSSGGMLLELSLGGQKFKFKPLGEGKGDEEQQGKKGAKAKGGSEEVESDDEDEQDDDGEESGMLGRAVDGVKGAASRVTDLAKERPIAATLIGAGLVAGLALFAIRAIGQRSDEDDNESEDDDDDTDARARDEDESEEEESDEQDEEEGEEDEGSSEEDEKEEDEESSNNHVGGKRSHRYR